MELDSWEKFEARITSLFSRIEEFRKTQKPLHVSTPIFRGQSDATWELETTLDRFAKRRFGREEYFAAIRAVRPAVISLTGKEWDLPQSFDPEDSVPSGYEFMIYLRHHGFPSPLLDWTRSPYVAAYFAFRPNGSPEKEKVAIYAFTEYIGEAKGWASDIPSIHGLGPYVISHKRHYAQQCEYTICKVADQEGDFYESHQIGIVTGGGPQDVMIKYILPTTEREKVLISLQRMNVTASSLFGSEESLMETFGLPRNRQRQRTVIFDQAKDGWEMFHST
ncbi:FRG domain-containing protein [Candidatus Nitrospira nitrosa]|nr:FRG domain-containing protein [Candidatus Nitrospira nitrosa]